MDAPTNEDAMYGMRGEDITRALFLLFGMEDNPEREAAVMRMLNRGRMEGEEGERQEERQQQQEVEVQEEEQEEEMAAPAGLSDNTNAGGSTNAAGLSSPPPRSRDRRRRRRNALRNNTIADSEDAPRSEVPFGNNTAVDADGSVVQVFENWDTIPHRARRSSSSSTAEA